MVGFQEILVATLSSILAPVYLTSNGGSLCSELTQQQIILLSIYRLTLHPYAKYPGPLLGKLTSLRAAYYAHNGDMHLDIERCHQKYGEVSVPSSPEARSYQDRKIRSVSTECNCCKLTRRVSR
jgi:hypothetical protein